MILPVLRIPEYLSPSSFKQWNSCPRRFYYQRMAFKEYIIEPQALPAAAGSAFDSILTHNLAKELGLDDREEFTLDKLFRDNVTCTDRSKAIMMADNIFSEYKRLGCFKRLLERGINELHCDVKKVLVIDGIEIPVYVKPDFINGKGTVNEVKVNGAFSKTGASPNPGYKYCWFSNDKYKDEHERYGEPLEKLNRDWAEQLAIYSMVFHGTGIRDVPVNVEQVAVRGDTFGFAHFDTYISSDFVAELLRDIRYAWKKIQEADIPEVVADKMRCHAYNTVCPFNSICPHYKNTFGDDGSWVDAVTRR